MWYRQPIKNQLNAWQLLPEPERLTELYFAQPNSLPTHYVPGQAQTISFTVHNLEYRATTYSYQVTEAPEGGSTTTTLTSGIFHLNQNQFKTLSLSLPLTDLGPRVSVAVNLPNQNESIHFWDIRSGGHHARKA